jgi:alkanesulfonate monooxygenase SsuD/methylene tetrahydromethanopterin reductase-like flavin-dependent oxidoreductase (luciferase family)
LRIGLGVYSGECLPVEGISPTEVLQNDLAQAKVAEEAGLDSIWISEHHFLRNGYNPSVISMAAAMAAVTSRIRIGPALVLAPLWHPIRLAEDSAMVDVLSGGRYTLGVGLGYRDVEYAGIGVERRTRGVYMDELVQIVKLAWSDQDVTFHGQLFNFDDVPVYPKPVQPGGIPMWIGGHAPAAIQRAARHADGFAMDGGTDSDVFGEAGHNRDLFWRVEQMVGAYKDALAREGKDYESAEFSLTIGGFVSDTSADDAWAKVREAYMYTRRVYGDWYGLPKDVYERWYPDQMSEEEQSRRRAEIWLGTPDDLAKLFRRLHDIAGDNLHVMFRSKYPGVDHETTCRSIQLLGEARRRALAP